MQRMSSPEYLSMPKKTPFPTIKLLLFAFVAVPLNCLWVIDTGIVGHGTNFTRVSLFMNTIFVLFVLTWLNIFFRRWLPKFVLQKEDLLLLYAMLSVSSGIAGHDIIQRLYPLLGHAFYFATPENEWAELFHAYVPKWLVVTDKSVLAGYYKDSAYLANSLYIQEHLRAWLIPSLVWATVVIAFVLSLLCISILLRRQWIEHERLSYPLAQIPLEVIEKGTNLFRTRLLWIGFAIAAGRDLINGLHYLYPAVPTLLHGRFMLSQYFTSRPWNALGWVPIEFHPFVIGLAYFMPLEMSFSTWFFYWFWRFERIAGSVIGVHALRGFPFVWQQSIGVCFVILVSALWMYRHQAFQIVQSILGKRDSSELRTNRRAIVGLLLSFGYLIGFCYWIGMQVWVAVLFFLILLSVSTVVTRIRAELGYPMHDLAFRPEDILVTALGTKRIGPRDLTLFAYLHFLTYAHRSNPQPHQLEAFKIADKLEFRIDKQLIVAMVLAIVVGSLAACWAYLHTAYKFWGSTWDGWPMFNKLQNWLTYSRSTDVRSLLWMGVGACMGGFFILMRRIFIWWPFHAAGYVVGGTWSLNLLWFSIFVSWLIKWIILKFGGLKLHRKAMAFFMGLVLGQFIMTSFWGLLGTILGRYMYRFI